MSPKPSLDWEQALGTLYQLADQRAQPEAAAIVSATLDTNARFAFRVFATAAGIPPERQRTLTLAAPVRLPDEGTLEQLVCFLRDYHDISFEELDQSDKPISMRAGPVPLHLALTHLARLIDGGNGQPLLRQRPSGGEAQRVMTG